jgi:pyruvate dehydrogenase E2 component (dihydrolipoamide acetyltransferase)
MATPVIMPKLGFTQESSQIVQWLKAPGDVVEKGEPLLEVTTDKVNMEVEAPANGILDSIRFQAGETVPVTEIIGYVRAASEPPVAPAEPKGTASPAAALSAPRPAPVPSGAPSPSQPRAVPEPARLTPIAANLAHGRGLDLERLLGTGPGGRVTKRDVEEFLAAQPPAGKVRAVPAARRAARELGVYLTEIEGSGPRGRVQSVDVRAGAARPSETTPAPRTAPETAPETGVLKTIPLTGMRQTVALRMQQSAREAPHITFEADVDVTAAEALRARANDLMQKDQPRISLTAIIARACAWALKRHPLLNSRLAGQQILLLKEINIGIAVALDEGLIVPVVRGADRKGLATIAAEISDLAARARAGRLRIDDVSGGTFSISNLGKFGVDRFTAIINPPETAILAVGRVTRRIVPDDEGRAVVRPIMTVTLSADHRVVDGAVAARFLSDVRQVLEHPELFVM